VQHCSLITLFFASFRMINNARMRRPLRKTSLASILFAGALLAVAVTVEAQQSTKVARIGFFSATSSSAVSARVQAFRQGMRELGYTEGKNVVIEYRFADGKLDRLSELAAELVRLKVDVIVSAGPPTTRSAKQATGSIPIVMAFDDDPVGNGFAVSLARPGKSITGLATLAPELSGKQLEILKEIAPKLSRVAVFGNVTQPGTPQALREINLAADGFRVQVQYLEVGGLKDIETAFRAASKEHTDAVLVLSAGAIFAQRRQIADLAVKSRLPAMYSRPEYVEDGGLISYGPSFTDLFRRAATYVDKILKGANPADLPIEQPKEFELVINLKAANQIGLTIPPNMLARAYIVIK
jgi:putative ABC transport system substrate-binding protein